MLVSCAGPFFSFCFLWSFFFVHLRNQLSSRDMQLETKNTSWSFFIFDCNDGSVNKKYMRTYIVIVLATLPTRGCKSLSSPRNSLYSLRRVLRMRSHYSQDAWVKLLLQLVNYLFTFQAVVVSIDPRRVYLKNPDNVEFKAVRLTNPGKRRLLKLNMLIHLLCKFILLVLGKFHLRLEIILLGTDWIRKSDLVSM